ncbi:unnamed protein product [Auanema sp. JU1783]|nr:unnamed protein product [Auanema sp. JU1783]
MSQDFMDWDRFREWIHSICIVTFDLELGQALEIIYPGDALLSNTEKTNVCYLAFPDSNSGNSADTHYHFRIRRSTGHVTSAQTALIDNLPPSTGFDPRYLYGFVHFRQQKDPTIPRGYYQKSIVLLTVLPFYNLFQTVVSRLAPSFFDNGEPVVEAACHDIDCWPAPVCGETYSLPFLGCMIQCRIPALTDMPYDRLLYKHELGDTSQSNIVIHSVDQINVYQPLRNIIKHLHVLWELIMIGEPLLIIANNPAICSSTVQALVSLIAPLKNINDYRPYFTIHDSEFKEYSAKNRAPPKVFLGVTNPLFTKALDHWPHILKIADESESESVNEKNDKSRKTWDPRTLDSKPGLYTQYKPFLNKDKSLEKKMKSDRPEEVQSAILRRHFLELTQSFMIPLERYISTLMPLRKEMSPFRRVPNPRPFRMEDFLTTIDDSGPSLTCGMKGDWEGLYRSFIASSIFIGWLSNRTKDVNAQLKVHYVDALCSADLGSTILSTKHNVEVVELVMRLRDYIVEFDPSNQKRQLLVKQVVSVLDSVEDDLKQLLLSNCALREILT